MSSRQEQKERRRREREERLKREKQAEQRQKLGQIIGGVVIVAAIVVGIVLAASGGGSGTAGDSVQGKAPDGLPIPPARSDTLAAAVKKAGCAYTAEFPDEGSEHVEDELTQKDYKTNPPTSGNHNPIPAADGYYPKGSTPPIKNHVHTLEHGRIAFQYNPTLDQTNQRKLRTLYNEDIAGAGARYHAVLMQNNTGMPYKIAATAWRSSIRCNVVNDNTWNALRLFYREKLDKGPEAVP